MRGEKVFGQVLSVVSQQAGGSTEGRLQFDKPLENGTTIKDCESNRGDTRACIALVVSLKACADQKDLLKGISLHVDIARQGLLETNSIIGGAVVNMYAKCGALSQAQEVFDALPARTVIAWNALISGYTQNEQGKKALSCFEQMQNEGISPDAVTIVCALNACGSVGIVSKGQQLHALIIKEGMLDTNVVVGNALIDMYSCCQLLSKAQNVFFELPLQNEVSWTTLITGFVQHGQGEEALKYFELMKLKGLSPTIATCLCILKACALKGAVDMGQEIHADLIKEGELENNMVIGTALVDMYAKCGALIEARKLFHELPTRDVVSWGALLDGYTQHTDGEEALECFEEMQEGGFAPDGATYICILKTCGNIGAAEKGQKIHAEIAGEGLFADDIVVINSLVDMYAKCGMLAEAQDVFDELPCHDVIIWNALLAGYAQLGDQSAISGLFDRMIGGVMPDFVTFLLILNVCGHRGLIIEGQTQFFSMIEEFGNGPALEHLTCMVDLFGRAGQIDEAVSLIEVMPVCADMSTMLAILGACQKIGDIPHGSWALGHAQHLNKKDSAAYVSISNLYGTFGMQDIEEMDEAAIE
ncbi:hypothetical protein KP509_18G049300 [Ceratopteris richardii]|nr:hypothetical protein KP509_18G049300 [Ceratopteris richardii]